jgi:hypothetical protein
LNGVQVAQNVKPGVGSDAPALGVPAAAGAGAIAIGGTAEGAAGVGVGGTLGGEVLVPPPWGEILAIGTLAVIGLAYIKSQGNTRVTAKNNPCAQYACGNPGSKYRGGMHGCMTGTPETKGDSLQSHHTPARDVSPLPDDVGPAIQMDPADHQQTGSWGSGANAQTYRMTQESFINGGNFMGAVGMDVMDVQGVANKAGTPGKYDDALAQMVIYANCLKRYGIVK